MSAAAAFKKRKINDWLWMFAWQCRNGYAFRGQSLMYGREVQDSWQTTIIPCPSEFMILATTYASKTCKTLLECMDALRWVVFTHRCETKEDWEYATHILRKYYS